MLPNWTVHYNIVSKESSEWIGTGWEFFHSEDDASQCCARHRAIGNVPSMRPYNDKHDHIHLGAVHQHVL